MTTAVAATCGAKNRAGAKHPRCVRQAGWGTTHLGQGKCKYHGGASPIKHGRYSTVTRDDIRALIAQHADDPDPLNLHPELAAMRALFQDYIQRYDLMREALLAWHASFELKARTPIALVDALRRTLDATEADWADAESFTEGRREDLADARTLLDALLEPMDLGKPRQLLDLGDAVGILKEIGKLVERIEKIRAENAISRGDLLRVMTEMGRVVQTHVPDDATQQRIRDGWLTIRV